MEILGMPFKDILYKYSWLNIQLLMYDKVRYVGERTKKTQVKKKGIMTPDEEKDFFKSLM